MCTVVGSPPALAWSGDHARAGFPTGHFLYSAIIRRGTALLLVRDVLHLSILAVVPADLEDSAPARALRGARAVRQRRGEEGARAQDDPRTAKSRLQRRTSSC